MKCPIDVEKKVAEMRQELHPDTLVEDAYLEWWLEENIEMGR